MKIVFLLIDFIIEPLGVMYLSSFLKKGGHQVSIVKTVYDEYEKYALMDKRHRPREVLEYEDNVSEAIRQMRPDVVAYSVTTGMHPYYLRINRLIKEKIKVISVFGGPHPTFFPELIREEGVDAVCLGEGEEAFLEFVDRLSQGKQVRTTENFMVKEDGKIYENQLRPLIADLDSIPFPDRELIYSFDSSYKNPIKNFIIGRGCPYNCTYCFNHAYSRLYEGKGKRIRMRSAENVIKEIAGVLKSSPMKIAYFQDDIFVLSQAWLEDFLPLYKKQIGLAYHCHLRADLVNEGLLAMLKDSGCISVTLALESGNDKIRNSVLKRNMSKDQIYGACSLLHRFGIKFRTENMIGLPGEDLKSALETLRMNIRCKPDIGWASLYQPYPKTILGEKSKQDGLYDGSLAKIKPSFFEESILLFKDKKRVENLQKLFSIIVEFPFLLPLASQAIKLPPNPVFRRIYKAWKEYCYSKRLYNVDSKTCFLKRISKKASSIVRLILKSIFKFGVRIDAFWLLRWFYRKRILILGYHGISVLAQRSGMIDFDYRHIPLKRLEEQVAYLKKHYNVLPLEEIARRINTKQGLPNNTAAITFDDGYADIYHNGFRLMKKYSLPSTVFLISRLVDTQEIPWFDKMEAAFATSVKQDIGYSVPLNLSNKEKRIASCIAVKEQMKSLNEEERKTREFLLLNELCSSQLIENDFYLHLNSPQINRMKEEAHFNFGSHSQTHPILTKVKSSQLYDEVSGSKKELFEKIGCETNVFCYPNGSYNETVEKAVKDAGYLCAVTTEYGLNRYNESLFGLKRIQIGGTFSFEYFVCSLFPVLKSVVDGIIRKIHKT